MAAAAAELGTFTRISSRGRDPVNMYMYGAEWDDGDDANKRGRVGILYLKIGLTTNEQGRERGVVGCRRRLREHAGTCTSALTRSQLLPKSCAMVKLVLHESTTKYW